MPTPTTFSIVQIVLTIVVCFLGILSAWLLFMLRDIKEDVKEIRAYVMADIKSRYQDQGKHLPPVNLERTRRRPVWQGGI